MKGLRPFRDPRPRPEFYDAQALVLLPEMRPGAAPPEITEACWGILKKSPGDVMCARSRMVVKRKGADAPVVVACTLIPYDVRFELGETLAEAGRACTACASFLRLILRSRRRLMWIGEPCMTKYCWRS